MHWLALQPQHESGGSAGEPAGACAGTGPGAQPGATTADPPDGASDPQVLADAATALGWWALRFTPRVVLQGEVVLLEVSASERLFGGRRQLITRLLAEPRPVACIRMAQADTALLALARLQLGATSRSFAGSPQERLRPHGRPGKTEVEAALPADHAPWDPVPADLVQAGPAQADSVPAGPASADHLPLHTLADALPHLATLERLGCQTWGDLRALPRGGVVRRFGAPLLDALDRAYGQRSESYPWLVLPEVFDQPLELMAQVEAAPALLFAARRLLAQLQVWLQARQQGVLAFELVWQMDARRDTATEGCLLVRTAVPTLDMAHLQRLLAEKLERVTLPAPVLYLRLRTVETAALSGATGSLLPDEQRCGDDLTQLLERLAARLGPQQVLRAVARADHRPEHMQDWVPAAGVMPLDGDRPATAAIAAAGRGGRAPAQGVRVGGGRASTQGLRAGNGSNPNGNGKKRRSAPTGGAPAASDALYPTWLLATPLRLAVRQDRPLYQGPLTLLAGPQRLEAAWWDVVPVIALRTGEQAGAPAAGSAVVQVQEDTSSIDSAAAPGRLALRDYFLARSEQAGLLWIYRERLMAGRPQGGKTAGHWYLHGVFG